MDTIRTITAGPYITVNQIILISEEEFSSKSFTSVKSTFFDMFCHMLDTIQSLWVYRNYELLLYQALLRITIRINAINGNPNNAQKIMVLMLARCAITVLFICILGEPILLLIDSLLSCISSLRASISSLKLVMLSLLNCINSLVDFNSSIISSSPRIIALSLRWDKVENEYAKLKAVKKAKELRGEVKRLGSIWTGEVKL